MNQSFDSNKHYKIMQAILIHVRKYNLDVRKTVIFLSHVLKGEFDYVTNDENARITLKNYGLEEIRKVIFENLIISEGVLLHNMEKANRQREEKGMSDEKRKLRYAYDIQNPEFQRTHNLDSDRVEDALERGLLFQCGNVGKNENPLYDWYLIEFASNVVSSRVELLLTGQVKLGWYHPSQIISFPSITRLLNSLNSAYYKRIQSKANPEVEEAVTVDSFVLSDEAEASTLENQQSSFGDLPQAEDIYNLRTVYELVGAGLGLAVTTLLLRKKKVNGDSYIYDVSNITEKEKEIIDSTYHKLTGESGKHFDYAKKLSKIDNIFNLKQEENKDYEDAKNEYDEVSASKELIESVTSKSSSEIDADLDDFEAKEREILNSREFSEEQKREMIEKLYSEFDEYTEKNSELSGRKI